MIERDNYFDVMAYLDYERKVLQKSQKTIKRKWGYLRHLLNWADEVYFYRADGIDPTFPVYLQDARNDGKREQLSPSSVERICSEARSFFQWEIRSKKGKFKKLEEPWIEAIRPPRELRAHSQPAAEREYYSIEMIRSLCNFDPKTLIENRDRAAVAMGFLSGMRVSALVTIPVYCVDLENLTVYQLPSEGVQTKNSKALVTYLLPITDLIEIVKEWTDQLKAELGEKALWYPSLSSDGTNWLLNSIGGGVNSRRQSFARGLRRMCQRAGMKYISPHKLRHGHGIFGIQHVNTLEEYKAFSQNMGHSTLETTDRFYGKLRKDEVKAVISRMISNERTLDKDREAIFEEFLQYMEYRKAKGI